MVRRYKLISIVLAGILLLTLPRVALSQASSPEACIITGDVDCSGEVNIGDVNQIIHWFNGTGPLPACPHEMDANGDCVIDSKDFTILIECLMGNHDSCFPLETCCSPTIVPSCCILGVGNVDGSFDNEPTIADISAMINMLYITGEQVSCLAEADINQSGGCTPTRADISLGDIAALIAYVFIDNPAVALPECLDCR
jgi:hypothetical protein